MAGERGEAGVAPGNLRVELSESRYDRQERVSWWDQDRLAAARVLVVGAGALGNEIVKNLVLIGVGDIVVVDLDVVEVSNLARCVLFRGEDEGQPKATVLARRAVDLNPDTRVTGIVGDVRSFGTGIAYRTDVIVGALDNREARLYCNRLAARTGRQWVDGAIEALSGLARVFEPPEVCYECTMTEADWEHLAHRQSCRLLSKADLVEGKVPTTASTASLVAAIETQEVVKLLHRDRPGVSPLRGVIVFDGANNDAYPLTYPTDLNCLAHHFYADPVVVAVDGSMTATRLAEAVWPDALGEPSNSLVVELGDNHVIGWTCIKCGDVAPEHRPAALIAVGEGDCPQCGEPRQPEFVTSIEVPGDRAETPFGDLGIRIDEVLTVRSGVTEERFGWLAELDDRLPDTWGVPRPVRMDEETLNA